MEGNTIEVTSATPDFEWCSKIFSSEIGVAIDPPMVRHLWATCFVQKRNDQPGNSEITGKELIVQKNPAEISDLTENNEGPNTNHNEEQDGPEVDPEPVEQFMPLGVVDIFDEDSEDEMKDGDNSATQAIVDEAQLNETVLRGNDKKSNEKKNVDAGRLNEMESHTAGSCNESGVQTKFHKNTDIEDEENGSTQKNMEKTKRVQEKGVVKNTGDDNAALHEFNKVPDDVAKKRSSNSAPSSGDNVMNVVHCGTSSKVIASEVEKVMDDVPYESKNEERSKEKKSDEKETIAKECEHTSTPQKEASISQTFITQESVMNDNTLSKQGVSRSSKKVCGTNPNGGRV